MIPSQGGVPPGAGGGAMLVVRRTRYARGSPGRGRGGVVEDRASDLPQGFPRARVGWRFQRASVEELSGVPPGAGGVAPLANSLHLQKRGSPGRGGGGAVRSRVSYWSRGFPRARVGWRYG